MSGCCGISDGDVRVCEDDGVDSLLSGGTVVNDCHCERETMAWGSNIYKMKSDTVGGTTNVPWCYFFVICERMLFQHSSK